MVKLVASVAVNTQNLSELGLLDDFHHMKFNNRTFNSFTAKDKDAGVNFEMKGTIFTYLNNKPITGVVQKIGVVESGDTQYTLKGLNLSIHNLENFFTGSIQSVMSDLFENKDTLSGSNFNDRLFGYDRADKIKGYNGEDVINGGKGSDDLRGGKGDDNLKGGKGHDTLDGNAGNDKLTGGSNSDTFVFDSKLNATTNVDRITDMKPGSDTIELDHSIFTTLPTGVLHSNVFVVGSAANDKSDRIVYDDSNGKLYYTPDGDQSATQIQFAKLDAHLSLDNTDFYVI